MVEKANITKGKISKSLDETALIQALMIASGYKVEGFTKHNMRIFMEQLREDINQEACEKVM